MPRQSRSRPAARPSAPPPQQARSASTAAYPAQSSGVPTRQTSSVPARTQAPPAQPGMMAQMAATVGSVAIGSTIGHGISNFLFGGRSHEAPPVEQAAAAPPQFQQQAGLSCDFQAKEFTKCLEAADVNSCSYYLEQLKACQAAARPY